MKSRYKTLMVIAAFTAFYFALVPVHTWCANSDMDCTIWREMVNLTRPVIHVSDGIKEWNGTTHRGETPSPESMIAMNMPFVLNMIVLPVALICTIVVLDKRKQASRNSSFT